jgi:hypothetical protein
MVSKKPILTATALLFAAALPLAAQEAAKPAHAASVAASEAGTYKVVTHRPYNKGQKYTLTMQASVHQEGAMGASVDSMEGGSSDDEISLVAKVTVMDINAVGEATMMMVHLDKGQAGPKGKVKAMALEGADLGMAIQKGRFRVTARDGRKVPDEEQMWLAMIFEAPTGVSSDTYLSPGKDVKPGDSWPVNREAWSKYLAAANPEAKKTPDPNKLEGKVTFVGVEEWAGTPCLHLKVDQTDKSTEIPDFTGEYFNQTKQDIWVPVDAKLNKNRAEGEQTQRLNGKIHSKDGAMMNMRNVGKITFKVSVE